MSDLDLTEAATSALRTAWQTGKSGVTGSWALHAEAYRLVNHMERQVREQVAGTLRGQSIWLSRPKDEGESQTAFALRLVAAQHYADAADLARGGAQ